MSGDLWDELKPRQEEIEAALSAHLSVLTHDAPTQLSEAMSYSLLAPGKRLRPLLVVLASEAAGGTREGALPAACAVEMVHTYSLVHDDLPAMDDDDLRRGLPTCHKKFGEATAILAGDALLTLAFQVLAGGCPIRTAAVSCLELAQGAGAVGMVGGQTLDLIAEGRIADQESGDRRQETEKTGGMASLSPVSCPLTRPPPAGFHACKMGVVSVVAAARRLRGPGGTTGGDDLRRSRPMNTPRPSGWRSR